MADPDYIEADVHLRRKKGKIIFTREVFETNTAKMGETLGFMKFIPVKVEYLFYNDTFEMYGHSFLFDEINPNETVPEYDIDIHIVDDELHFVDVERLDND